MKEIIKLVLFKSNDVMVAEKKDLLQITLIYQPFIFNILRTM